MPPRERSGPRSSNRFSFQHSYGLGVVLALHQSPDDYCVLFDIHDDLFVLNCSINPTLADVYQIKTDAAPWTAHSLTKREKNKDTGMEKPSVLGNLYDTYIRFPACIRSMSFVASAPYSMTLTTPPPCSDREFFGIADIEDADRQTIHSRIASEHSVSDPPAGHAITYLRKTSLSVKDHEVHTEGVMSTFLTSQGDGTIPPAPFHKTMRSELRRRNDKEISPTTFAELATQKGLCRADVQRMIDAVTSKTRQDDLAALLREQMTAEGYDVRLRMPLLAEIRKYLAERLDPTNLILAQAGVQAGIELLGAPAAIFTSATPLADTISYLASRPNKAWQPVKDRYSGTFLQALFSVQMYEHQQLPPPGPQPEEEKS